MLVRSRPRILKRGWQVRTYTELRRSALPLSLTVWEGGYAYPGTASIVGVPAVQLVDQPVLRRGAECKDLKPNATLGDFAGHWPRACEGLNCPFRGAGLRYRLCNFSMHWAVVGTKVERQELRIVTFTKQALKQSKPEMGIT
jgi:hypothetical protein